MRVWSSKDYMLCLLVECCWVEVVDESKQVFLCSMFHKLVTQTLSITQHNKSAASNHTYIHTTVHTMTRVTWSAAVAVTMMVLVMSSSGVQGQSIQSQFDQASCGPTKTP